MSPYVMIGKIIERWAQTHYYTDFLVTLSLDGKETTELLLCEPNAELEWLNDWWEGQKDIKQIGFRPVTEIVVYGLPQQEDKIKIESTHID